MAMDGYAVRFADLKPTLRLRSCASAGAPASRAPRGWSGQCAHFHRWRLPEGADSVVMQERRMKTRGAHIAVGARPKRVRTAASLAKI
jgi:molybdopterin biosynthesis enzyme